MIILINEHESAIDFDDRILVRLCNVGSLANSARDSLFRDLVPFRRNLVRKHNRTNRNCDSSNHMR